MNQKKNEYEVYLEQLDLDLHNEQVTRHQFELHTELYRESLQKESELIKRKKDIIKQYADLLESNVKFEEFSHRVNTINEMIDRVIQGIDLEIAEYEEKLNTYELGSLEFNIYDELITRTLERKATALKRGDNLLRREFLILNN